MKPFATSTLTLAAALVLGACQSTPPAPPRHQALVEAGAAVALLRSDPAVARAAPVQVGDAEAALRRAQNAWDAGRDEATTRHLAYLAVQRAEIARNIAGARIADARAEQAGLERERLLAERKAQVAHLTQAQAAEAARAEAAREGARAETLRRQLELIDGRPTARGMAIALPDALFEPGRERLRGAAARVADRIAAVLRQHPERRVLVEGYTDNVGGPELNLELSRRRAEAFRQALLARGVAPARIDVSGHGEAFPLTDNTTAAGRRQNRRVEVLFSDAQGQFRPR